MWACSCVSCMGHVNVHVNIAHSSLTGACLCLCERGMFMCIMIYAHTQTAVFLEFQGDQLRIVVCLLAFLS